MQTVTSLPAPSATPAVLTTLDGAAAPEAAPALEVAATLAPPTPPTPLILFGRDERGRPHASSFVGSEVAAIEAAARLMGLSFVAAGTDAVRDLAASLPAGRLFPASGKAFVPFCSGALYDRLLAATGTPDTPRSAKATSKAASKAAGAEAAPAGAAGSATGGAAAGGPAGKGGGGSGGGGGGGGGAKAPGDWPSIRIGSIVLAQADDEEGYYPARVAATKADDHLVLI